MEAGGCTLIGEGREDDGNWGSRDARDFRAHHPRRDLSRNEVESPVRVKEMVYRGGCA